MFKVLREVKDGFVVCLRTPDEQRAKEKTISLIDEGIKAFMQGEVKNAKTEWIQQSIWRKKEGQGLCMAKSLCS